MAETEEAPTLEQLETIVSDDPGPESVADSIRDAMDTEEPGQERDETGRFKTQETDEIPDGETPPAETPPVETAPDGEAAQPVEPAPDWTLEEQNAFRELPVAQQKFIMDRSTSASEASAKYSALDEVLQPRIEAWARNGMDTTAAVRQLLALSDWAARDPEGFIQHIAQQRGIDLAGKAPAEIPVVEGEEDDPIVAGLNGKITALTQQIEQLGGTMKAREDQDSQAQRSRDDQQIVSFSGARDDKNNLEHPYFDQVRPVMGALMGSGEASDLQTAYDMACHANPEVRAKIGAASKAADDRDRARKEREKAAAANKAGSSVSGQPGARTESQPSGDLREDLRAKLNAQTGASVIS